MPFPTEIQAAIDEKSRLEEKQQDQKFTVQQTQAIVDQLQGVAQTLVTYLHNRVAHVEVDNQLTSIETPDVAKAVAAIKQLETTSRTDANSLEKAISQVVDAVKAIRTPELKVPDSVRVNNLDSLESYFKGLQAEIAKLKLNPTFDPKITVTPAEVTVQNDFSSVTSQLTAVIDAVKAIELVVPPAPEYDDSDLKDSVDSVRNAIDNLIFPVPNFTSSFVGANGQPVAAQLTNDGKVPISGTITVDTTGLATSTKQDTGNTALQAIQQDTDFRFAGGKTAYGAVLNSAGDNVVLTPTAGKRLQVYWVSIIPNSDNTAANLVTVKLGAQTPYISYACAHWEVFTGAINDTLIVNLANTQPVAVTIHYKEIT